jgi:outer membrane protein OmpA-like peptidoglycan-associated protein
MRLHLGQRQALLRGSILTGLAALGLPALAQAQPITGLYIGGGVGYNQLTSQHGSVDALPGRFVTSSTAPVSAGFKGGYGLVGSIGYGVGNGVRLEGEVNYRTNAQTGNIATSSGSTTTTTNVTGNEVKYGFMANVLFDIPINRRWISPYIGAGFGYQLVDWNKFSFSASNIDYGSPTIVSTNGTIGQFAYQAIIGASFPIDAVPGLSATVEYRYVGAAGNRNYSATGYTQYISSVYKNNNTKVHVNADSNQTILVGFRYAFNPNGGIYAEPASPGSLAPYPAQAAVPAPAAIPARTYLVFFDFDRADLTPRARDIVAEAVRASPSVPHTRIEVSGNTDSAGDPAYNQRLSLARAQAVAAELGRWGVPRGIIDIHGYGDTRPLMQTEPGAREPQNRRVEIVYR